MTSGKAKWTHDTQWGAWYFELEERSPPPYRKQLRVQATIDLDADGRVAGIEFLAPKDLMPPKGVK